VTKKSVVREPTISRKRKATQSKKISPTSIQKEKRKKKDYELGGRSYSIPEAIIVLSSEPSIQVANTPELNIQNKKNPAQSKVSS
jgi:hypothetical protein